jgi:hypothetical protein
MLSSDFRRQKSRIMFFPELKTYTVIGLTCMYVESSLQNYVASSVFTMPIAKRFNYFFDS